MSFWFQKSFETSLTQALDEFKKHDYVEKLKTHITLESMPSDKGGQLLAFLHDLTIHIWWYGSDFYLYTVYPWITP